MAHVRKQIRDAVVTRVTSLTTTGANVYRSRFYPIAAPKLPGLLVYTLNEGVETTTITKPRTKMRSLDVVIEGYAIANSNLDNTLDQISLEVEEAMATDTTFGGLAKDSTLVSVEVEMNAGEGEQVSGYVRLTFTVVYATSETDAEVAV